MDEVIEPRPDTVPPGALQAYSEGMKKLPYVLNSLGFQSLRSGQDKAVMSVMMGRDSVVILPTSTGKCLGRDTPVLMYDGSRRLIQDVKVGDLLASPTGRPNRVVNTTRGRSMLYRVDQIIGEPYVVNGAHILSLRMSPTGKKRKEYSACGDYKFGCGDVANVSVEDYTSASTTFKHRAKGWKSATDFDPSLSVIHPDLPPYILGVWLGDGDTNTTRITSADGEIVEELHAYAASVELYLHKSDLGAPASTYGIYKYNNDPETPNRMRAALVDIGVLGNKHIPQGYLRADRHSRLELLAGLLDTDGSWGKGGYDFIQKRKVITEAVVELARSVGMRAQSPSRCAKECTNTGTLGVYWRTFISPGNGVLPPCRITRKKGAVGSRSKSNTTGVTVSAVGHGDYYGFELDGDHLFLLGDYTVTHNSACFVVPTLCMGWKTIVIYPLIALMRDQAIGMQKNGLAAATISSNETDAHNAAVLRDWSIGNLQFMLVSPERFANANWAEVVTQFPPDFVCLDECFVGDVEILTADGFVRFDELRDGTRCAQVDPDTKEISYVIPSKFIRRDYAGEIVHMHSTSGVDLEMTPNHDILRYRRDGSFNKIHAHKAKFSYHWRLLGAPTKKDGRDELTPDERLQVAYQADGNRHSKTFAAFSFSKERKIVRFLQLMKDGGYEWSESNDSDPMGRRRFLVRHTAHLSKIMRGTINLSGLSTRGCRALVEEAITWDGSDISDTLGYFSCTMEENTDFFQEVCVLAGMRSRKTKQVDDRKESYKDVHRLFIRRGEPWIETQNITSETRQFEGEVFCVEVPTGCIVVRRNGKPVVIGNCHTFGDWADTFRPGYKFAGEFIRRTRPKVVAAYSATLSEDCENEVREGLGISGAKLVYHYPRRTNLHPSTMYVDSIRDAFPWVAQECHGPTIIYASTRARVESYAASLAGFTKRPVYYYHGGMKPADKKYQQDKFMADSDAIIVATNAFGMGIDKGNIRHVVHFDIPGTLVAYCQEMGRAGRDGKDSYCTIIPTPEGIRTRRHFIRCGNPTAQDIRDFVKAASGMRSGRDGVINAKRDDIARKAGLDVMTIGSIMAFCLGEGIFVHDNDAAKKMRIKFMPDVPSFTKVEAEMRDAIEELGVDMDRDGWLHLDIRALSEQVNREPATVMSRLLTMQKAGKIEWVRSTSTKPLRLGLDIDAVDPESFARLNAKSASANACLQQVLDYCDTVDEEKHAFLESHLNR